MALIRCTDCGKDYSDEAASCVGCGRPNRAVPVEQTTSPLAWVGLVGILILALLMIFSYVNRPY